MQPKFAAAVIFPLALFGIFFVALATVSAIGFCAGSALARQVWFAPNDDLARGPNRDRYLNHDFPHRHPLSFMHADISWETSWQPVLQPPAERMHTRGMHDGHEASAPVATPP